MPPPPVWGATVGNAAVCDDLCDGVCDALGAAYVNEVDGAGFALAVLGDAEGERGEAEAEGDVRAEADVFADAGALADVFAEAEALAGPDTDPDGEKIAGCVAAGEDAEELVQAVTAATQTVKVAAPTAVVAILAAAPAGVARTFMKPPTEWIISLAKWSPPAADGGSHRARDCHKS